MAPDRPRASGAKGPRIAVAIALGLSFLVLVVLSIIAIAALLFLRTS